MKTASAVLLFLQRVKSGFPFLIWVPYSLLPCIVNLIIVCIRYYFLFSVFCILNIFMKTVSKFCVFHLQNYSGTFKSYLCLFMMKLSCAELQHSLLRVVEIESKLGMQVNLLYIVVTL